MPSKPQSASGKWYVKISWKPIRSYLLGLFHRDSCVSTGRKSPQTIQEIEKTTLTILFALAGVMQQQSIEQGKNCTPYLPQSKTTILVKPRSAKIGILESST